MQTHGGVSRCFAELYCNLPLDVQASYSIHETDNVYAREIGIGVPRGYDYEHFVFPFHFPFKSRLFAAYNSLMNGFEFQSTNNSYFYGDVYQKKYSIELIKKKQYEIFHPTFFDDYFLQFIGSKPFVLTIHDMISWIYSNENNDNWKWQVEKMKILAPKASAIIAVSENTKKDIIKYLKIPEDKIYVIYHGCSFPKVKNPLRIISPSYILYVGDRGFYKNFEFFIRDVAPILKKHEDLYVVCTGKPFSVKELQQFDIFEIKDRFVHYWVANDGELYSLYHNAVCFVYPSEYEGFGIPILEAYQADCPVLLNNASCFPEIAGDAAIYFNMTKDNTDFANQFELLYGMSSSERSALLVKQRKRLNKYSWKQSALKLVDVYNSIL